MSLPAEQRDVLILQYWCDMSLAEIATALGESRNTIASRSRYGLNKLKRLLGDDHER